MAKSTSTKIMTSKLTTASFILLFISCISAQAQKPEESNFAKQTIDMGIVVTDIKKSLKFYKEIIGFSEKEGFKVAGKFPKAVGLTDGSPLSIHVLTLGEEVHATSLKLMQVDSQKPARSIKQPHIHTIAGLSYLTIFVKDVDLVLKRAKQLGYKPYAKSPQILPEGLPQDVCLLMLKDPDGNFVEIVGPLTASLKPKK